MILQKFFLQSLLNSNLCPTGWFGITFSSKLKNGKYVASIDLPYAYDRIQSITVQSCTAYNNYETVELVCDAYLNAYSRHSILVRCEDSVANGISANVWLDIVYK